MSSPNILSQWRAKFANLQPREQRLIQLFALVLLVSVMYVLGLKPLMQQANQAKEQLTRAQEDLAWLQNQAPSLLQARLQAQTQQRTNLTLAGLHQQISQWGWQKHLSSIKPQGNNTFAIDLQPLGVQPLMSGLVKLEAARLEILSLKIQPLGQGQVKAQLVVQ